MKTVLVTGGTGFIGQYVVERLDDEGLHPLVLDSRGGMDHLNVPAPSASAGYFFGDIRDEVAVTEAMAHADGFIHLAGVLGTQETIANPIPAAHTNIIGGLNILQAAAQYDVPGVYIGVGNHWMDNTYSISKTTVERFVRMYNAERGTRVNIVRVVNAYGPRQVPAAPYGPAKVRKITPAFLCRALLSHDIEIYGDGKQVSDMVYVGDVARCLVRALQSADEGHVFDKVIEVGPVEHNTVNEIAELAIDIAAELGRHDHRSKIVHVPMRPGEVPGATVVADTTTLSLIDEDPYDFVSLPYGMKWTAEYFARYLGIDLA